MTAPISTKERGLTRGAIVEADGVRCIIVPVTDYERLIKASECDDMIVRCEVCNAWLDRNEEACANIEDFTGCWKIASDRVDTHLCRSWRAVEMAGRRALSESGPG